MAFFQIAAEGTAQHLAAPEQSGVGAEGEKNQNWSEDHRVSDIESKYSAEAGTGGRIHLEVRCSDPQCQQKRENTDRDCDLLESRRRTLDPLEIIRHLRS